MIEVRERLAVAEKNAALTLKGRVGTQRPLADHHFANARVQCLAAFRPTPERY